MPTNPGTRGSVLASSGIGFPYPAAQAASVVGRISISGRIGFRVGRNRSSGLRRLHAHDTRGRRQQMKVTSFGQLFHILSRPTSHIPHPTLSGSPCHFPLTPPAVYPSHPKHVFAIHLQLNDAQ